MSLYQRDDKRKDVAPVRLQRLSSIFNFKRNNETFLMKSTKWGEIGFGPSLHFISNYDPQNTLSPNQTCKLSKLHVYSN